MGCTLEGKKLRNVRKKDYVYASNAVACGQLFCGQRTKIQEAELETF